MAEQDRAGTKAEQDRAGTKAEQDRAGTVARDAMRLLAGIADLGLEAAEGAVRRARGVLGRSDLPEMAADLHREVKAHAGRGARPGRAAGPGAHGGAGAAGRGGAGKDLRGLRCCPRPI